MMRIGIIGTGIVGGYFGGRLAHGGEDVAFVGRGTSVRAIRDHGLRVEDVAGTFDVRPALATEDPRASAVSMSCCWL
jgi:2-dehydropantoate 2-reductase